MKRTRQFVRDGRAVTVVAEHVAGDHWRVRVGDAVHESHCVALAGGGVRLQPLGGGRALVAHGVASAGGSTVRLDGTTHTLSAPAGRRAGAGAGGDGTVRAPMTGTVLEVACAVGDAVTAQQTLVVVSAMKMEHKLAAGVAGVVRKVAAAAGTTVEQGDALVVVEPAMEASP